MGNLLQMVIKAVLFAGVCYFTVTFFIIPLVDMKKEGSPPTRKVILTNQEIPECICYVPETFLVDYTDQDEIRNNMQSAGKRGDKFE